MAVITRGALAKLMRPGLWGTFGDAYQQLPAQWAPIYEHNVSHLNYEEDQMVTMMGLAPTKSEGASVGYDDIKQNYLARYTHVSYGLGFIITIEEIEDNLYLKEGEIKTKGLAYSMAVTKNYNGADVFNFATDATRPIGDGQPLLSASHPTESGNMSNILSVSADLSETSLEDILNQLQDARDNRNKKMALRETGLLIPLALQFEAERILKNPQRPNTAERDINAMFSQGRFPKGIMINQFLTDPRRFYILTTCPNGLKYFERTPLTFTDDNDFDTDNMKFKVRERYSFGVSDWRAVYSNGSP